MNIKNIVLFLLKRVGLRTKESLYVKQPYGSLICFPLAIHNLHIHLDKIPPSFKRLKKLCGTTDKGTFISNIPEDVLEERFGLVPTHHSKIILKKGGLLYMKNPGVERESHTVFVYPIEGNKRSYICINFGTNHNVIERMTYRELKSLFVKFNYEPSYRGFYLKQ